MSVVAVYLCENCGELLRSRFEKDPDNYTETICGECGRGPTTRLYGANEPIRAIESGLCDSVRSALITECEVEDGDEWDFTIQVKVKT